MKKRQERLNILFMPVHDDDGDDDMQKSSNTHTNPLTLNVIYAREFSYVCILCVCVI